MSDPEDVVIKGNVVFPAGDRPEAAARFVVRIEDVSVADAPSTTVAQSVLEQVRLPPAEGGSLPFQIEVPKSALDPKRRYSVRIHVDVSGTGTVTTGDFVSTRSYPVQSLQSGQSAQSDRSEQSDQSVPAIQVRPV